jgi:hypothetical protein
MPLVDAASNDHDPVSPIIEERYLTLGLKWPIHAAKRVSRFLAIGH